MHPLVGGIHEKIDFFHRPFLGEIKTFLKTSQLPKNYGEAWAPLLKNSRSYSVFKFGFFWRNFGSGAEFRSGAELSSLAHGGGWGLPGGLNKGQRDGACEPGGLVCGPRPRPASGAAPGAVPGTVPAPAPGAGAGKT